MADRLRFNSNPCPRCNNPIGLRGWQAKFCDECALEQRKIGDKTRKKAVRRTQEYKEYYRNYSLVRLYGITTQDFNQLFESQGNCCAICRTTDPGKNDWALDHDHETDKNRGILCHKCNLMIGLANDNPGTLMMAIVYLEQGAN